MPLVRGILGLLAKSWNEGLPRGCAEPTSSCKLTWDLLCGLLPRLVGAAPALGQKSRRTTVENKCGSHPLLTWATSSHPSSVTSLLTPPLPQASTMVPTGSGQVTTTPVLTENHVYGV